MFIGKPICIAAAGAIAGVCLLVCLDKKVSAGNKVKLIALTTGLTGIVASL